MIHINIFILTNYISMLFKKNSYKKMVDDDNTNKISAGDKKQIQHKIMAKYKNKYYNCKILHKLENKSKVLFVATKYITFVDNKDILF